jgi:hypothetical protein
MLIDRATAALESARSSGEVLEARDMARMAYDAAKSAARIMRAKEAHDSLIADVHRSQAHALAIRARAEMRLAEEYDAAQERGEVGKRGDFGGVSSRGKDTPTAADLGLAHKDIHEFRAIRDAEREEPGVIQRTIDKIVERGEEPTRAALNREISRKPKPAMPREPLWVWGRVKDFDRDGILKIAPAKIATQMTAQMRHDMREQLPAVIAYLTELKEKV